MITYEFLKQMRQELKGTGMGLAIINKDKNGWNNLPEWKKQGVKRTFSEIAFFVSTLVLISVLGAPDDDDDELTAAAKNMMIYQAYRLKSELAFYVHPGETLKILRSPSATVSTVEKLGNALWSVGKSGEAANFYQRAADLRSDFIGLEYVHAREKVASCQIGAVSFRFRSS